MSSILFVVNVIDVDLVTPCKIYEGVGYDFEPLYNAACEAVISAREDIKREDVQQWFEKQAEAMETTGGYMYATYDNTIEVYASRYKVSMKQVGNRKRRVGKSPPRPSY